MLSKTRKEVNDAAVRVSRAEGDVKRLAVANNFDETAFTAARRELEAARDAHKEACDSERMRIAEFRTRYQAMSDAELIEELVIAGAAGVRWGREKTIDWLASHYA
jgi:hypothetical protein